jgi:5-methylcytosine-specific restriction endonuclease McrA
MCKVCACAKTRAWAAANPERVKEAGRAGYQRSKDAFKMRARLWAKKNPLRRREIAQASAVKHRDKKLSTSRVYNRRKYHQDIERSRAIGRARAKEFRERNPEGHKAIADRARAKRMLLKPEVVRLSKREEAARRRALKKLTAVGPVNFERIMRRDAMRCHLCRKPVKRHELHFDHVIPLARGGEHVETNIAVAHGKCNMEKNDKLLTLF